MVGSVSVSFAGTMTGTGPITITGGQLTITGASALGAGAQGPVALDASKLKLASANVLVLDMMNQQLLERFNTKYSVDAIASVKREGNEVVVTWTDGQKAPHERRYDAVLVGGWPKPVALKEKTR